MMFPCICMSDIESAPSEDIDERTRKMETLHA